MMTIKDRDYYVFSLIQEYLQYNGFSTTLDTLRKECTDRGKPNNTSCIDSNKNLLATEQIEQFINLFNCGDKTTFFRLWNNTVMSIVDYDQSLKKLTLFLHVYFAIYPFRVLVNEVPIDARPSIFMEDIHTFLESTGADLIEESDCIIFFALPFTKNPKQHSSFSHLFEEHWISKVRANLKLFLENLCPKESTLPRLSVLLFPSMEHRSENNEENSALTDCQRRLMETEMIYKSLKKQLMEMKNDYNKLIGVCSELATALESALKNEVVDLELTLENCTKIFPELFTLNGSYGLEGQKVPASEFIRKSIEVGIHEISASPLRLPELDFPKIKNDLVNGSLKSRLLLLQAIRWNITRIGVADREYVIRSYIQSDMLGLSNNCSYTDEIFAYIDPKKSTPYPLQQSLTRLINSFSSIRLGRDYLATGYMLVERLSLFLTAHASDALDHITRDMVVATLQKLSLRHTPRVIMIEKGVMEWLVAHLSRHKQLGSYALEYSAALLMNLCMSHHGKEKCTSSLSVDVLKVLCQLLQHQNNHIIAYVNGTLYTILGIPEVNEEAKKMEMESILRNCMKETNGEINRQLDFILRLHLGDKSVEKVQDAEDKEIETDDIDLLEEELDADDPVKSTNKFENSGKILLDRQYRVFTDDSELLIRPTTPRIQDTVSHGNIATKLGVYNTLYRTVSDPALPTQPKIATCRQNTVADLTTEELTKAKSLIMLPIDGLLSNPLSIGKLVNGTDGLVQKLDASIDSFLQSQFPWNSTDIKIESMVQDGKKVGQSITQGQTKEIIVKKEYDIAFTSRPKIPRTPPTDDY